MNCLEFYLVMNIKVNDKRKERKIQKDNQI